MTGATRIYHHWWFTKYSQSGTVIAIGKVAVWSLIYGGCHLSVRCAVGQIVSGHSARFAEWKISIHSKSYWPQRFFLFFGPMGFPSLFEQLFISQNWHYQILLCSSMRTWVTDYQPQTMQRLIWISIQRHPKCKCQVDYLESVHLVGFLSMYLSDCQPLNLVGKLTNCSCSKL